MLITMIVIYCVILITDLICTKITSFQYAKGWWILVPFRTSGWKSSTNGKVYTMRWVWTPLQRTKEWQEEIREYNSRREGM